MRFRYLVSTGANQACRHPGRKRRATPMGRSGRGLGGSRYARDANRSSGASSHGRRFGSRDTRINRMRAQRRDSAAVIPLVIFQRVYASGAFIAPVRHELSWDADINGHKLTQTELKELTETTVSFTLPISAFVRQCPLVSASQNVRAGPRLFNSGRAGPSTSLGTTTKCHVTSTSTFHFVHGDARTAISPSRCDESCP